ncbi:N-6 DNA methylase [Streptomyces sporangiiformans]|uniref:N-6 DNA methylase n=1 Tax=Streptomyces sporangiiformans TaxID=2315329 RepID=UPI0013C53696|nr:N-6 DNA methylase [Streptomyces sporangiiformans]
MASVDGEASEQLRRLVPLDYRRQVGAFFTPAPLKQRVSDMLKSGARSERYLDPACGSGDLLLAASQALPIQESLKGTLEDWTDRLHGWDINSEFVEAARFRLLIAALLRHGYQAQSKLPISNTSTYFTNITAKDGLEALRNQESFVGHVVLNPPFSVVSSPLSRPWTSRPTSAAALFTYQAAHHLADGSHLTAILPDVLRSGSRYSAWRTQVNKILSRSSLDTYGQFDEHADVDVFLLSAKVARRGLLENSNEWWNIGGSDAASSRSVNDFFSVRVGTVVDNRDPLDGPEFPFARARDLPSSGEISTPARRRKFSRRVFEPPFVLVRRTSRPSTAQQQSRLSGVLVTGEESVAVDNHLIVASPRDGSVKSCQTLLKVLSSKSASEWLDNRIRCRHLTVGAVREIPWTDIT